MFLSYSAFGQSIEEGWKGILPLKTSRAEVENRLGRPEVDDDGYYRYKTDDAFIRVNYSCTPCQDSKFGRGQYKVATGTVLDYYVIPKDRKVFSNLELKRDTYIRDTSGDVQNNVLYVNKDNSVIVSIHLQEGTEYVGRIYYNPRSADAKALKCGSTTQ
jgi:hypothetical protein